jgi:cytochrome d ubiquinol oxidase subunit I
MRRQRKITFEIAIPNGASLILKHHADGVVPGLDQFEGNHPPVLPLFWGFRIMVGIGVLMLVLSWSAAFFLYRRNRLPQLLAYALVPMALSGWVATLSGWYVTEIGRQPWLVTGVLKTADAVGTVTGGQVAFTLVLYLALYAVLLVTYLGVLVHLALKAGKQGDPEPNPAADGRAIPQPAAH